MEYSSKVGIAFWKSVYRLDFIAVLAYSMSNVIITGFDKRNTMSIRQHRARLTELERGSHVLSQPVCMTALHDCIQ